MCVGPLTNAIRVRPTAWRWRTASAAPLREYARTVSTEVPAVGRPITTTGAADTLSSAACSWVRWRRGQDQPVDVAVPEVADQRELVVRVGAGRVEQQPDAGDPRDLLDRRDHGRVDRVADIGHCEGDLARPARAERPRGCVRDVADRLGRGRDALERGRARPDPVQDTGRGRDGDVGEACDGGDRRDDLVLG